MTLEEAKHSLQQTLTEDIDEFFEQVYTIVSANSKKRDDFMFQQGRYNNLKKQSRKGLVSSENLQMTTNQIRYALQETIKELKDRDVQLEETDENPPPLEGGLSSLEKQGLQSRAKLIQEKLNFLEEEQILAVDPSARFAMKKRIEDLEEQLAAINEKLANV